MKSFWKEFRKGLFTKSQFLTGVTITLLTTSAVVYAFNQLALHIFAPSTTISASQVNANFEYLKERIDYLAGGVYEIEDTGGQVLSTTICCDGSFLETLTFESVVADFSPGGDGAQFVAAQEFTIAAAGTYKVTFSGQVDTTTYNDPLLNIMPVKRYIDTGSGSTYYQTTSGVYLSSSNLTGAQTMTMTFNAGDVLFVGAEVNSANAELAPGFKFKVQKE
jgi:hypothetical protein